MSERIVRWSKNDHILPLRAQGHVENRLKMMHPEKARNKELSQENTAINHLVTITPHNQRSFDEPHRVRGNHHVGIGSKRIGRRKVSVKRMGYSVMAYAYRASSGAVGRPVSKAKSLVFAKKFFRTATITSAVVAATAGLTVASLSILSVGEKYSPDKQTGLARLALTTHPLKSPRVRERNIVAKKFSRFALEADASVTNRFASLEDAAVETLTDSFMLANIGEAEQLELHQATRGIQIASVLTKPVTDANALPSFETTGSVDRKATTFESREVALATLATTEELVTEPAFNPFDVVLNDPEVEIPTPSTRPTIKSLIQPKAKPAKTVLAYAKPDSGLDEVLPEANIPSASSRTAIYVITEQKVYMPDGKVFEAHSGLGDMRDNPKYIKVRARGPTPPNRYKLSMREKPFHGVPALRMTPTDWSNMHGRNGILAHTYLRRRPGDSAGCIAFKDYYAFLKYYKKGLINEIIVVARTADLPKKYRGKNNSKSIASLFGRG